MPIPEEAPVTIAIFPLSEFTALAISSCKNKFCCQVSPYFDLSFNFAFSKMIVKEVVHPNEILKFLQLPYRIYARDKDWIAPLESDIEAVFNPHKNPAFLEGEAIRWIVEDEQGQCIGRVAAFYHKKHLSEIPYPCGGMGFFECINHKETAFLLFDTSC